jgi:Domain of unknown function (DUF1772)
MFMVLQVISLFLVAVAMALSLAHALELPGKRRLDKPAYLAVQTIYYPGFTWGGGIGDGLGTLATLALLLMTPAGTAPFWWTLVAFAALVGMHGVYWIVTHPVNKFWLRDQTLGGFGGGFFAFDPLKRSGAAGEDGWVRARDRWEGSHVLRAVLAAIALLALIIAVAL